MGRYQQEEEMKNICRINRCLATNVFQKLVD